jgi:diguanylate cyclase (GGDEF)-like protein/PAS domain S-box-containing protein
MNNSTEKSMFPDNMAILTTLFEETSDPLFIRDQTGVFVMANSAYASLMGVKAAELIGKSAQQILPPEMAAYIREQDQEIISAGKTSTFEEEFEIHGVKKKFRIVAGVSRDGQGLIRGTFGIMHDLSGLVQAEARVQKYAEQSETLLRISHILFEVGLEYPAILDTVAKSVSELFSGACGIHLLSDDGRELNLVAFYHPDARKLEALRGMFIPSRSLAEAVAGGWVVPDEEPHLIPVMTEAQIRMWLKPAYWSSVERSALSLIVIPLRTQRGLIGSLSVAIPRATDVKVPDGDVFLKELAHRAAFAIENARLHSAETLRLRELNALYTATRALLITLDLDSLLGQILDAAMSAIPSADRGMLNLIAPNTGKLEIRAMFGYKDPRIQTYTSSKIQGYAAQAVKEKRPLLIHDAQRATDPGEAVESSELNSIKSIIVAPLMINEQVLGALVLNAFKRAAFTENDLRLLVSFAATTSAAIKNAMLHSEVQHLAITDALTNLYNRRGFFELGRREIERARRFGHPLSAVMLDIDHFKIVNDSYGHAIGDQVLEELANRLSKNVREFDILGRYGGEEFVLLLPETDLFTACSVSDRLRLTVMESPMETEIGPITITISLGVVKATADIPNLDSLLKRADKALYTAKQNGRNRVEVL